MKAHLLIMNCLFVSLFSCDREPLLSALEKEMSIAMETVHPAVQKNTVSTFDTSICEAHYDNQVVFIAGFDEGNDTFYTKATRYFENQPIQVVKGLYSLAEIVEWLNQKDTYFSTIHIVSHSNAWRGMSLKTSPNGNRITTQSLATALQNEEVPSLQKSILEHTNVIFHSCGLGDNTPLLQQLKTAFTNEFTPMVSATPYFNVYGGKYATHFLAKPYYVYYPTGHSPGPLALAQLAKKRYPGAAIDWHEALTIREETAVGTPYSYRFNIPVSWEVAFDSPSEIPSLDTTGTIIDFVLSQDTMASSLLQMNIPLESYRWRTQVKGNSLVIKGKCTVLTVLAPVMDSIDSGTYQNPNIENTALFTML